MSVHARPSISEEYRREQLIWFTLLNNISIFRDCRNQPIHFIKQDSFLIELLTQILRSRAPLHAVEQSQINDDGWFLHDKTQSYVCAVSQHQEHTGSLDGVCTWPHPVCVRTSAPLLLRLHLVISDSLQKYTPYPLLNIPNFSPPLLI